MIVFEHASPVTFAQLTAELERELAMRRQVYPVRVSTARMTPAQADRELALCAAWREDVERVQSLRMRLASAWSAGDLRLWAACRPRAATHGFSWRDRRQALAREMQLRARVYADQVATARLTKADAEHRTQCLETLARLYDYGWDWPRTEAQPTPSLDPDFHRAILSQDPDNATARAMLEHLRQPLPHNEQQEALL